MVNIDLTLIAQVVNFLFLVFVLAKFAYKPLLKIMDERKNKIANDLAAAESAKAEAETVKNDYLAKLAEAKQEAQSIVEAARKNAQAAHDKIMADTKAEQEQVIAAAKETIAMEKQKAMAEVRAQVVELSLAAAGKIIEKKLGTEDDKAYATQLVDSLMK